MMSTATYPRRNLKTGRPLSLLDVFSKITDDAARAIGSRVDRLFSRSNVRDSRIEDAAAVRRLADQQRRTAPGFASDLYAAADRHELIG